MPHAHGSTTARAVNGSEPPRVDLGRLWNITACHMRRLHESLKWSSARPKLPRRRADLCVRPRRSVDRSSYISKTAPSPSPPHSIGSAMRTASSRTRGNSAGGTSSAVHIGEATRARVGASLAALVAGPVIVIGASAWTAVVRTRQRSRDPGDITIGLACHDAPIPLHHRLTISRECRSAPAHSECNEDRESEHGDSPE
jgi:hypothetical protein